jgi:ADP-ribose pyrophosphatase YjhB (NUDIX family)
MDEKKKHPTEVVSVAVMHGSKMLMGKRRDNQKWTHPAGHIEEGEGHRAGALRELKEETGIDAPGLKYIGSKTVTSPKGKMVRVHSYRCDLDHQHETTMKEDPDKEVHRWHWVETKDGLPDEIHQHLHSPKNVTLEFLGLQKSELTKGDVISIMPRIKAKQKQEKGIHNYPGKKHIQSMDINDALKEMVNFTGKVQNSGGFHRLEPKELQHGYHLFDHIGNVAATKELRQAAAEYKNKCGAHYQDKKESELTKTASDFFDEKLAKLDFSVRSGKAPAAMHGWISPEGKYHHMGPNEEHMGFMRGKFGLGYDEAHEKGWISVGHAGGESFNTSPYLLKQPDHPAIRTLRNMAKDHWGRGGETIEYAGIPIEYDKFVKFGTAKTALGKSESYSDILKINDMIRALENAINR